MLSVLLSYVGHLSYLKLKCIVVDFALSICTLRVTYVDFIRPSFLLTFYLSSNPYLEFDIDVFHYYFSI